MREPAILGSSDNSRGHRALSKVVTVAAISWSQAHQLAGMLKGGGAMRVTMTVKLRVMGTMIIDILLTDEADKQRLRLEAGGG